MISLHDAIYRKEVSFRGIICLIEAKNSFTLDGHLFTWVVKYRNADKTNNGRNDFQYHGCSQAREIQDGAMVS
jgi:hypothetical protein